MNNKEMKKYESITFSIHREGKFIRKVNVIIKNLFNQRGNFIGSDILPCFIEGIAEKFNIDWEDEILSIY